MLRYPAVKLQWLSNPKLNCLIEILQLISLSTDSPWILLDLVNHMLFDFYTYELDIVVVANKRKDLIKQCCHMLGERAARDT